MICIMPSYAADFPASGGSARTFLSDYGMIQNVQTYSTNPGYNGPNTPYNKAIVPKPIYAQGTDVKTGECQIIVSGLVAAECSTRNYCSGLQLVDIRPHIMVQLSTLSGENYVTACAGYIDTAFIDYKKNTAGNIIQTGFPTDAVPSPTPSDEPLIDNPYEVEPPSWKVPIIERAKELKDLQSQNATDTKLVATSMPTTINDLSFVERTQNAKDGLNQWKCDPITGKNCAYKNFKLQTDEAALERQLQVSQQNLNTKNNNYSNVKLDDKNKKENKLITSHTQVNDDSKKSGNDENPFSEKEWRF